MRSFIRKVSHSNPEVQTSVLIVWTREHQINRPDDHPLGPNVRSLGMEITYNGSATVRTTGHHHPDAA
jgi:hypothetical protein